MDTHTATTERPKLDDHDRAFVRFLNAALASRFFGGPVPPLDLDQLVEGLKGKSS